MLYTKPKGVKYTDMAIYIDKHVPEIAQPDEYPEVENTTFKYLYLLANMIAHKNHFFYKNEDYDDYSSYLARQMYFILRDRYVHQGEICRGKLVIPIKSSLNFIKSIAYGLKVNYQKENFNYVCYGKEEEEDNANCDFLDTVKEQVQSQNDEPMREEIKEEFNLMPSYIKKIIENTPYSKQPLICKNLYISCLISFLKNITLPDKDNSLKTNDSSQYKKYIKKQQEVVLWHLDASFKEYVKLMMNKTKKTFGNNIENIQTSFDLDDNIMDSIVGSCYDDFNSLNGTGDDNNV